MSDSPRVTANDQRVLVVNTVRDLNDLRDSTYLTARDALDTLTNTISELPLTIVDTEIGTNLTITWDGAVSEITEPTIPTWIEDALAEVGAAPVVPAVSISLPTLSESPPIALTGSVGTPGSVSTDVYSAPNDPTVPTITALSIVPTIDTIIPTVNPSVLDTEFDFTEPTYTGEISSDLESAILNVIGGNPVLAQTYWDARLAAITADISKEQAGRLRTARNKGAATYWPLPSEATLVSTQVVNNDIVKALQKARIELGIEQTRQAREDFWESVKQGLAYEQLWVDYNNNVAQRALGAAETLANVAISVHNANANYYNTVLGSLKLSLDKDLANVQRTLDTQRNQLEIDNAGVARSLSLFQRLLEKSGQALENIKTQIQKHQVEWSAKTAAFDADSTRGNQVIQRFAEIVKAYGIEADTEIKSKSFILEKSKIEADVYATQYQAVNAAANAAKTILDSQVAIEQLKLESDKTVLEREKARNLIEVEVGKVIQAAQEAKATIDVSQTQWAAGQSNNLINQIAQLAYGYAQAVAVASDVSLGSSVSFGSSYSETKDLTE